MKDFLGSKDSHHFYVPRRKSGIATHKIFASGLHNTLSGGSLWPILSLYLFTSGDELKQNFERAPSVVLKESLGLVLCRGSAVSTSNGLPIWSPKESLGFLRRSFSDKVSFEEVQLQTFSSFRYLGTCVMCSKCACATWLIVGNLGSLL